jgi:hypothetical protein
VAGHRAYRAISQSQLKSCLARCRLVLDNLEETWKHFDWNSIGVKYVVSGDSNWLSGEPIRDR